MSIVATIGAGHSPTDLAGGFPTGPQSLLLACAIYRQEKFEQFDAQYAGDFLKRIDAWVFFPAFDATKIRAINARIECKLFLRNGLGNANALQILPDKFAPLHGHDGQYLKDIKPLDISIILRISR